MNQYAEIQVKNSIISHFLKGNAAKKHIFKGMAVWARMACFYIIFESLWDNRRAGPY